MPPTRRVPSFVGKLHGFLYQMSGGRVGGRMSGARVVLLTTAGRKSGRERTTPLLALPDGENTIIVASNGGRDRHPAWWLNLRANPDAELQVGSVKTRVRAEVAGEEERARLWPRLVEMYSEYDRYQQATERQIPVVILRSSG